MDFVSGQREREQLHALADQLTDAARHLARLNPTSRLPAPETAADVLAALAGLQQYVLSCAGDVGDTGGLDADQARAYQRAVLGDALVAPVIAHAITVASSALIATGHKVARTRPVHLPTEGVSVYLDLLDAQSALVCAAGALRELAGQLTHDQPAALAELAALLASPSSLRGRAVPAPGVTELATLRVRGR
ncbi:hypothetical protein [Streptomyces sp. LS1784]|uniref:hypothetical protein n=1 Tax=Streptomyces sp. LS1784 TaxID=2851533 RepID=UPI001CCBC4C7|nr:hypothetical protein [Streptomyces sp. LS1784]